MQVISIEEWLDLTFSPKSRPTRQRAIRLFREGKIPSDLGEPLKFGNQWLVKTNLSIDKPVLKISLTGDPVVDAILKESVHEE